MYKPSLDILLHLSYNQVDIDKLQKEIKQSNHQTDTDAFHHKSKPIQTITHYFLFHPFDYKERMNHRFQLSKIFLLSNEITSFKMIGL